MPTLTRVPFHLNNRAPPGPGANSADPPYQHASPRTVNPSKRTPETHFSTNHSLRCLPNHRRNDRKPAVWPTLLLVSDTGHPSEQRPAAVFRGGGSARTTTAVWV